MIAVRNPLAEKLDDTAPVALLEEALHAEREHLQVMAEAGDTDDVDLDAQKWAVKVAEDRLSLARSRDTWRVVNALQQERAARRTPEAQQQRERENLAQQLAMRPVKVVRTPDGSTKTITEEDYDKAHPIPGMAQMKPATPAAHQGRSGDAGKEER
jgi:hypothetical protein